MAVEQSERNYYPARVISISSSSPSSSALRPDEIGTHSLLCSSPPNCSCDGRRSSSNSVPSKVLVAPTGSAPLSRMDEVSQGCLPSTIIPTSTTSITASRPRQELIPCSFISLPDHSGPRSRSQSLEDDTVSSSISTSSASTLQSINRPAASQSSDNSLEDDGPTTSFFQKPSSQPGGGAVSSRVQITASNSSGSSGKGDKDKDIGGIQVTFNEDGQIRGRRSSADFQQSDHWVPLLSSPAADPASNPAEALLTDWNESPFVSSYHGHNQDREEVDEDECIEWSSRGSPWHIDISKVELGEMVASGSYGMVYKGLYKDEKVAVKMLLIPEASSTKESRKLKSGFRLEIDVWYTLNHPNIVQFIGAYITPPRWAIVTEFLHGGSLRAYLVRQQRKKLPHRIVQSMALDIARGMEYLHQNNIMHRDLKSANLLLDDNGRVKVADFGLARFETEDPGNLTAETGTIRWMAPEVICHSPYTRKIDVYSFGIVMWELCTSLLPFEGMSFVQLAHAVAKDNHRPPTSDFSSSTFTKLMVRCWDKDATRRPEFSEIVKYLETGYSANLESKMGTKTSSKKLRNSKGDSPDKYSRPTLSMRGGRVVGRTTQTEPTYVANHDEDDTDQDEWLNVSRQCRCTIV